MVKIIIGAIFALAVFGGVMIVWGVARIAAGRRA